MLRTSTKPPSVQRRAESRRTAETLSLTKGPAKKMAEDGRAESSASVRPLLAAARTPISKATRDSMYHRARGLAVLAVIDALEDPAREDPTAEAARTLLAGVDADGLAVLLEPVHARTAHDVVEALAHSGLVEPAQVRLAHLRIDLRIVPQAAAG
jgi:hypothetical protein